MQNFQTGSMRNGKTYPLFANNWITSLLLFFSCQKKKSSFQILSKNFLVYHVILLKRCSHITLLEWTLTRYRVIGPCTEILVISQSRKAHAVHAWKFMYNETYISFCIVFDDPWESYCPWNFKIFTQKFKTRKLFVVETRNQLECIWWPLTLKIGQGQRSRSSRFYKNKAFL